MRAILLSFFIVAGSIILCLVGCDYRTTDSAGGGGGGAGGNGNTVQTPRNNVSPDGLVTVHDEEGDSGDLRAILEYDQAAKKYQVRLLGRYDTYDCFVFRYHYEDNGEPAPRQERYFKGAPEFRRPRYLSERVDEDVKLGVWYEYAFVKGSIDKKDRTAKRFLTDRLYIYVEPPDAKEPRKPNPHLKSEKP